MKPLFLSLNYPNPSNGPLNCALISTQLKTNQNLFLTHFHPELIPTNQLQKAVLPTAEIHERLNKKLAVSAEPVKLDQHKTTLQHHSKSAGSKQLIRDAVHRNDFLKQLAKEQIIELVECM